MNTIDDKQLSPPGIPVNGISDTESDKYDDDSDDEPVKRKYRKLKNPDSSRNNFQSKTLP